MRRRRHAKKIQEDLQRGGEKACKRCRKASPALNSSPSHRMLPGFDVAPEVSRLGAPASRSGRRILGLAQRIAGALADIVYPPSCLVCQAATAEPRALCAQCWARLRLLDRQ